MKPPIANLSVHLTAKNDLVGENVEVTFEDVIWSDEISVHLESH